MHGYELVVTNKIIRLYKRYQARCKYISKILKQKNPECEIALWTDDPKLQPYKYQKIGINVCTEARLFLLGDDMGLGKTIQGLGIILKSFEYYGHENALIVCESNVKLQWYEHIQQFTKYPLDKVRALDILLCPLDKVQVYQRYDVTCKACKLYEQCKSDKKLPLKALRKKQINEAGILIINYEALRNNEKEIANKGYDVIIFDEATKLKNWNTGIYKAVKRVINKMGSGGVVIPMSGTFIENKLAELYSVINLIDDRILGLFSNFRDRYLVVDHFNNVIGEKNEEELKGTLDKVLLRRTIDEEWKDAPPISETLSRVRMSPEHEKLYKIVRDGKVKEMEEKGQELNMANVGALLTHLMMLAGSALTVDEEFDKATHSPKITRIKEILTQEIPERHQVVIFTVFANKILPYIQEELAKTKGCGKVLVAKGGMSDQEKANVVKKWKNGKARILLCSDAMARGGNMQNASYLINFDFPWNPAKLDQRIRRVYRPGQKKHVRIINMIVEDTAEEHVYEVLATKRNLFEKFLKTSKQKKLTAKEIMDMI
jgi:SNF2 family DNA or RNA helicase